ncbi:hypothetical protein Clacol_005192 [Clathrus columnatus]|uniref:G-patch domain-containing protein n=1 Tax=Clathrus columnatus TaxID=1419009 RepID=A0AAV5AE66_9AGAM|nr:hypothetical protein Clacol_005192 [Clathrus columnatus]
MARRKRAFLDDESDSSNASDDEGFDGEFNEDPDAREARELFENPYKRQKRKRTKEDEIYGVFNDEDDEEASRGGKPAKRFHFTQAPSFVTGEEKTMDLDKTLEEDEDEDDDSEESKEEQEDDEEEDTDAGEDDDENDIAETPFIPHATEQNEEKDDAPRGFGGLSSAAKMFAAGDLTSMSGIGSKGGIGSKTGIGGFGSKNGIGLGFKAASTNEAPLEDPDKQSEEPVSAPAVKGGIGSNRPSLSGALPTQFGTTSTQRSFLRDNAPVTSASVPLSLEERMHFSKISGTFGAKVLAKMGWQAGTGLGVSGTGIVTPVETKMRPKPSMGLAYKGFKEKTEQSKAEARRRGEKVSDDEEVVQRKKKGEKPKSDVWKKPKKTKIKVEHQTYEQILQNAGPEAQAAGIGKIYDATSGEMREVSSLAEIASWTPSTDTMRIPEIRHNLRLIVDAAKGDLDGLVREARTMQERKKWIEKEDIRLRHVIKQEAELDEIKSTTQPSGDYEVSLESFSPYIEKLVNEFAKEYETYRLDEIVVAAIAPTVKQQFASWQPLKEPTHLVDLFRRWRNALKFNTQEQTTVDEDPYGVPVKKQPAKDLVMTPYESLMWNAWLPRVRSTINNEWSPLNPDPVIQLYEAWSTLLPPFIRDNMFDQLVIPKLLKGISDWNQRNTDSPSLQAIVFPWLPHLGLRVEELTNEAKRKVKLMLRNWKVTDEVPKDLLSWKEIFGSEDWTSMLLKYVVPKLGATLREDFKVNPRKQEMKPLQVVLNWQPLLNSSIISQLLETEFFPKWLDVLHVWLIQPKVNLGEVADWYTFWKETFPAEVRVMKGVAEGFTRGLQLMDKARNLGPEARTKLPKPERPGSKPTPRSGAPPSPAPTKSRPAPSRITEITFRSIVEEFAASHDLLFIPTGRAHEKSRMPLFRVSRSVDGKGGVLVYILDDAVWAVEGEDVRAITLDEMVLRASRGR